MKILLDAHISRPMAQHLRHLGHDCLHAGLLSPGTTDRELLELAADQDRIIITSDKDFGELVFRWKLKITGVLLLRLRYPSEVERTERFASLWSHVEPLIKGSFVTLTNRQIRRTPLPDA